MTDFQFGEQFNSSSQSTPSSSVGGMVGFLIEKGIAKTETSANVILVTFSLVLIALSIYLVA